MNAEEKIRRLNILKQLLDEGLLTPEEVEREKRTLLSDDNPSPSPPQQMDKNTHMENLRDEKRDFLSSNKMNPTTLFVIMGACLLIPVIVLWVFRFNGRTNKASSTESAIAESAIVSNQRERTPNTESAQVIPKQNTFTTETDIQLIKDFYSFFFSNEWYDGRIDLFLSPQMKQVVIDAYDYDHDEGEEVYGLWIFGLGHQDGSSDLCKVDSVIKKEDGWYEVKLIQMGTRGTKRIRVKEGKIIDCEPKLYL